MPEDTDDDGIDINYLYSKMKSFHDNELHERQQILLNQNKHDVKYILNNKIWKLQSISDTSGMCVLISSISLNC
jgi:hypothetical protein